MKRNSILLCAVFLASQALSVHAMENSTLKVAAFCFGAPLVTNLVRHSAENFWANDDITDNFDTGIFSGICTGFFYLASYAITKTVRGNKPLPGVAKLGILFSTSILSITILSILVNKGKPSCNDITEAVIYGSVTGLGTCGFALLASHYGLLR